MRFLPVALLGTALLAGCGGNPTPPAPTHVAQNMEVSVDLQDVHRCSRISPEIEIPYPPQGTDSFLVNLEDVDDGYRTHGGGSWELQGNLEDGAIIAEGALTKYYTGPCPPASQSRVYQYVVKALDVNKKTLSVGTYTFLQE